MRFTRDSALLWLPVVGGLVGYLGTHFELLQHAFPGLGVVWASRIELCSGLVALVGAYLRMSPLSLSAESDFASREHDQTLSMIGKLPAILVACALAGATLSGCAPPPPTLSPTARVAFTNTRVIKSLDLLRDTAISANAQQPPLLSEAITRRVVQYHASTLRILHAIGSGWGPTVQTSLQELLTDLAPSERQILAPYVALVQTLLAEVAK